MPALLRRILVYIHCLGVNVSNAHFQCQKVLANLVILCIMNYKIIVFLNFINLVFSLVQEITNITKIWKTCLSQYNQLLK